MDLLQNAEEAGASQAELAEALARAVRRGRFDREHDLLRIVAGERGLSEKDYWVTHTLWALLDQGFEL